MYRYKIESSYNNNRWVLHEGSIGPGTWQKAVTGWLGTARYHVISETPSEGGLSGVMDIELGDDNKPCRIKAYTI